MNYGTLYRWHIFIILDLPCEIDGTNNNYTHTETLDPNYFIL